MYQVYSFLTAAGMLLISPYFLIRALLSSEYLAHARQRLGWDFPPELAADGGSSSRNTIWIHAVSVGEVLAVLPLARQLKERHPNRRLVVSTTTFTGQQLARDRMKFADAVFYFPLDWAGPVRRTLHAARPGAIIIVETEIWPNFLREARRAQIPVLFVNGRLSERSFSGFRRAMAFPGGLLRNFLKTILNDATLFLMQSDQDASRLLDLGADPQQVLVSGNLKYDFGTAEPTPLSRWLTDEIVHSARCPVVVAGSVMANEEHPILEAFAEVERQFPRALLILAPRKPDRFEGAAKLIEESGHVVVRRSTIPLVDPAAASKTKSSRLGDSDSSLLTDGTNGLLRDPKSLLLLDSLGELASIYDSADVVFVGGSLVPTGGHNILEPAAFGKAPIYGPFMENFSKMASLFLEAGAAIQVNNPAELASAWLGLLTDAERAGRMGAAARKLTESNRGATLRVLGHIERIAAEVANGQVQAS